MMKKKWIILLGLCIFGLGLSACSGAKESPPKKNSGAQGTNENEEINMNNENQDSNNTNVDSEENELNDSNQSNDKGSEENEKQEKTHQEDPAITAVVNKEFSLSEDYAPDDLVTVEVPTVLENPEVNQLRKVAADALKEMFEEAKYEDVYLHARSGYRSYQTQVQLYQRYVEKNGEKAANRYSAKAGQSEHQTGLVMDVTSESANFQLLTNFGELKEGKWLKEYAHEYGFIIRYPEGKEDITGYIYEPWHIRYLGVNLATDVYESGLTYEEYLLEEENN